MDSIFKKIVCRIDKVRAGLRIALDIDPTEALFIYLLICCCSDVLTLAWHHSASCKRILLSRDNICLRPEDLGHYHSLISNNALFLWLQLDGRSSAWCLVLKDNLYWFVFLSLLLWSQVLSYEDLLRDLMSSFRLISPSLSWSASANIVWISWSENPAPLKLPLSSW